MWYLVIYYSVILLRSVIDHQNSFSFSVECQIDQTIKSDWNVATTLTATTVFPSYQTAHHYPVETCPSYIMIYEVQLNSPLIMRILLPFSGRMNEHTAWQSLELTWFWFSHGSRDWWCNVVGITTVMRELFIICLKKTSLDTNWARTELKWKSLNLMEKCIPVGQKRIMRHVGTHIPKENSRPAHINTEDTFLEKV